MKQKSLFSFFGKPQKKLRLNDGESNQHAIQGEDEVKDRYIATSKVQAEEDQVASVAIEETDASNDKVNVEKKALLAAPEKVALKTNVEEQHNDDTDTTQSKESDDSNSSSSHDDDEEEEDHSKTADSDTSNSNSNSNPHEKSEYELMRERNIARNNARLKALGLLVGSSDVGSGVDADNRKKQRRRTKAAKVTNKTAAIEPTRRSSRLSGVKMNYTDDSDQVMNQEGAYFKKQTIDIEQVKEEEEQFKVSPLFDYQMNDGGASSSSSTITASEPGCNISNNGKIKTLVPSGKRLVPPAGLNAIYSLQFYNEHEVTNTSPTTSPSPWLVGAGKSGLIAVWDCNNSSRITQEEDKISYVEPVMSWKGHGGRWIADARFLPPPDSSNAHVPSRLLTAGNDGSVCHWDLSTASLTTGAPRLLHQTNKSLHASGIFSMDVKAQQEDCLIVTGSKDKSIAVSKMSRLADNDGALWRSQFHTSKVASVSFSSSTINPLIASASDDGLVGIHDMRIIGSDSNSTVACLEDSHVRPHSAVWKPLSDSIFLTAGLDDVIKLWDLRNTSEHVVSFHGHVPASGKLKRIHRPTFFNAGSDSFILSGGENSHAISMFQVDEETNDTSVHGEANDTSACLRSVFSRGKLPDGSGDVGSMAVHSNQVAVTVEGGEVIVLTPQS